MVGYQAVDDDIEEAEAEIREAEAGQGTLRERAVHTMSTFAYNHPKGAVLVLLICLYMVCHIAFLWLPTILFWFVLVPGVLGGILWGFMNKFPNIPLPWSS
mmetsp:Transcript_30511/g.59595  ORF Transcript_30511/g.59595 Transcript_30511/m.59595 type:complete len:101 (+) Transcript_30511:30-332(+)